MHESEEVKEKEDFKIDAPETDLLFYKDFHQKEATAKILNVVNKDGKLNVIVDRTVFYPEGGGQPSDKGIISIDDKEFKVSYASKMNNIVLHQIDISEDEEFDVIENTLNDLIGKEIKEQIDWTRRITLARHHTATHLVVAAAKKVLGDHIWQAGAQKGLTHSRIDLSHYKRISQEEL